ncbi:DUF4230 domain-containing protein [Desertivirga arenae]|uniref:DUF4230 domain-containing protein n=1 Tax=Desertivirga arenae TaxID=2810309 RepID=UPI001A96F4EF|nr:DUF4230 domain-containing protein [Pedobacter sp. SYSU D00823]
MISTLLRRRTAVLLILVTIILAFLVFLFVFVKKEFLKTRTEVSEDVIIEKIANIGKLELVKYTMKDVIEKKISRPILPDKRILFVAAGEVTGCIDLTRVVKDDIKAIGDSITIFLPKPEICYVKLDHQRSKVYDLSGVFMPQDRQEMIEDIYKLAEQRIQANAREQNILGKTQENAQLIFKPLLENIAGKKVVIKFK